MVFFLGIGSISDQNPVVQQIAGIYPDVLISSELNWNPSRLPVLSFDS